MENLAVEFPATGLKIEHRKKRGGSKRADPAEIRKSIRSLMWEKVGIVRSAEALQEALTHLQKHADLQPATRNDSETQNMLDVSRLIAHAAFIRQESRGAHYRSDYPNQDNVQWNRHITFVKAANEDS